MAQKFYQLIAKGPYQTFSGIGTHVSRKIYPSPEQADAAIPEFIKLCCHSEEFAKAMTDLEEAHIKVGVVTLELSEN